MLAELADGPFDGDDWVFEKKYDGYRALALCNGRGDVELYSRNLLSFNDRYKTVVAELKKIKHACLIDGEVVAEDEQGRSGFQLLQNYMKTGQGHLKYYVFDILFLDGNDTTALSLLQRKELLRLLVEKSRFKNIFYSPHINHSGIKFFKEAGKEKWEGIMAKRADSIYLPDKRSGDWLKVKITNEEEAIIGGITEPQGARKFFGSLLLGMYDKGQLIYTGNCGTGFDFKTLKDLYKRFEPLFIKQNPFSNKVKNAGKVQWIKPEIVCQVKFSEWTSDGSMRHPVFLGLRADKKATEVKKQKSGAMKATGKKTKARAKETSGEKESSAEIKVAGQTLKLTNQNKIYWPGEKITKGDLIKYYNHISDMMLPYLKDRPESMHRFPNGINAPGFFQKDVDTRVIPAWLKTQKIYSESNKADIDYLVCSDKATLIYMANLGCIEINPWNSRIQSIANPDWMVIDLDPEDISFKEVIKAAQATKTVCDDMGIKSYCKTSGATGLHIFIPLNAAYEYEIVKNFAHLIGQKVNEILPDTTSLERMPAKRKKKIYLDFLQNRAGQTLAAPYSVRPRPGATVSTPLNWDEVNDKLDPTAFTIKTIFKRLDKLGDLWKPVIGKGADLNKAMKKMS
jgi:bifunctional non-homologous end joining protein LigD